MHVFRLAFKPPVHVCRTNSCHPSPSAFCSSYNTLTSGKLFSTVLHHLQVRWRARSLMVLSLALGSHSLVDEAQTHLTMLQKRFSTIITCYDSPTVPTNGQPAAMQGATYMSYKAGQHSNERGQLHCGTPFSSTCINRVACNQYQQRHANMLQCSLAGNLAGSYPAHFRCSSCCYPCMHLILLELTWLRCHPVR
jgi:hypothetical protein